jgi:hypothetical protein
METAEERLSFAVRFAEMALDQLRPGDWLNLRDDLVAFLSHQEAVDLREAKDLGSALAPRGGIVARAWKHPKPEEMTEADLRHLQEKTREFLNYVVEARRQKPLTLQELADIPKVSERKLGKGVKADIFPKPKRLGLDVPEEEISLTLSLSVPPSPRFAGRCVLCVEGDTRGTFLTTLLFLLAQQPTNRVSKCPECSKIFLRVRKQQFCGRTCVNRANKRAWRQTPKGRAAVSRASRAQYERKVKQKTGMKHPKIGTYRKRKTQPRKEA